MLSWKVYISDMNSREIKEFDIFKHGSFVESMKKFCKKNKNATKEEFVKELKTRLMFYMWSRCEWEIVICDFPNCITIEELDRLSMEREEHRAKWGHDPYRMCVDLDVERKIDVYDQVMLNWDIFSDYVWEHRSELK